MYTDRQTARRRARPTDLKIFASTVLFSSYSGRRAGKLAGRQEGRREGRITGRLTERQMCKYTYRLAEIKTY
jgi:hypothetical protein